MTTTATALTAPATSTTTSTTAGPTSTTVPELPCQTADADWFAEHGHVLERAKQACGPCPLRQECLRAALDRREPWGVWGGEIFVDGVVVATKRGRGRPRKHPVPSAA